MFLATTMMHEAPTAIKVKKAEGVLEVTWGESRPARIAIHALRCSCGCAACVDEHTGMKILDDSAVPAEVGVTDMRLVGNYAVQFVFTDGHDTGLFTWDHLRALCLSG
jgi:DUF971 family protein